MSTHGLTDFCLIVGDLADAGRPESFVAVGMPSRRSVFLCTRCLGNHDCDVEKNTRVYSHHFPDRLNYAFIHKEWQFVGLDSTEREKSQNTRISEATLAWLDRALPTLDRTR